MSVANGTAKKFQSDNISAKSISVSETLFVGGSDIISTVEMLTKKVKELEEKVASFETEETN